MKKILSLGVVLALVLSCAAFAEPMPGGWPGK